MKENTTFSIRIEAGVKMNSLLLLLLLLMTCVVRSVLSRIGVVHVLKAQLHPCSLSICLTRKSTT